MLLKLWRTASIWLRLTILLGVLVGVTTAVAGTTEATPSSPSLAVPITVQPIASGFDAPVALASTPVPVDQRLFVVEQGGIIRIMRPSGDVLGIPFLDISDRVISGGEQGLLGLAFHPNYVTNGYFYVNYTNLDGDTTISRFSVSPANRNRALPGSEAIILVVAQPFSNHNGGDLAFGPDGYLYIPLGDGGSGGDPLDNSQNLDSLLGKILRLDVDGGFPYAIPPDNPFVGLPGADEIWAYGYRNPWRFSFDRLTGDMYIGDVGQNDREEIDFEPAGSAGGGNYGWRCYEGSAPYNLSGCSLDPDDYIFPIHEYTHAEGCAVTGGYVYRGTRFPTLAGHYFFADYCSGIVWDLLPDGMGGWTLTDHGSVLGNPTAFGESSRGDLYVADASDGTIYLIGPATQR